MPRFRRLSMAALAVLPVLPLSASLTYLGPGHAAPGAAGSPGPVRLAAQTWDLAMTRHFGHPGNAAGFSAILMTGGQLWAFGGTNPGGSSTPIADELTGKQWAASALPARLTDFISDASATSKDNIWAISSYGRYVLHWDGTRWQLAHRWDEPGALSDVVATSPRSAWVFGTAFGGARGVGTWHFDGQSWQRAGGAASDIYRASVVSGRGIWAIAARPHTDAILRFDGRRWHQMRGGRAIAGIRWRDIVAESARDVWLLGDAARGHLVFAHWDGVRWRRFVTPVSALAGQLTAARNGGVLATATAPARLPAGLIVMMTSKGHVTTSAITSALGCGVSDSVVVARTGAVWASGGTLTKAGGNAAVWVRAVPAGDRNHDNDDIH
jgi:hypothetical protein